MKIAIRYIILGIFLFLQLASNYAQENRHEISLGANYPVHFAPDMYRDRELGIDLGYQYTRIFDNNVLISTGLRINVYFSTTSWKKSTSVGTYIPFLVGYEWKNFTLSGGFSSYINPVINFIKYSGYDPETELPTNPPDAGFPAPRVFGLGFNVNLSYNITDRWIIYLDFLTLGTEPWPIFKTNYGLMTFGFKFRF